MPDITRNVEVSISLSPFDMGREFAKMYSDEQAKFFQGVATEVRGWPKDAGFQWDMMRKDLEQLPDGLDAFKNMAQYAEDF